MTFIGYSEQHKIYRFVDLETEKVTISRDAKFLELEEEETMPQHQRRTVPDPIDDDVNWIPLRESERAVQQQEIVEPEDNVSEDADSEEQSESEQLYGMNDSGVSGVDLLAIKTEPPEESDDLEEVLERVPEAGAPTGRNRGKLPKHLEDYDASVATLVVVEPTTFNEAM
ncbi:uncharacterized protein LOC134292051 [Aedes albopictus]|uniref:Retroviral polymerase SH3-like domain-containing protein n=1 Tax=Aedes albopictus TaxID=7160 RepID=A0ABM1ZZ60_AEDAL